MKVTNLLRRFGQNSAVCAGTAILAGSMMFCGPANADVNYFEDFESATLNTGTGDTPVRYTNTVAGWTVDNSNMGGTATALEYQGGNVLNLADWVAEAGQGRNGSIAGGPADPSSLAGDQALVFDPDQWDDTQTGGSSTGYNSSWSTDFDFTGEDLSTIAIGYAYEMYTYPTMRMLTDVSFDGGTTFQTLLDIDSDDFGNSTFFGGVVSFAEGTDFNATSTNMTLRFSMLDGGNDWWGAVDNVTVSSIPEPASAGVVGLGLLGLVARRRKKNN